MLVENDRECAERVHIASAPNNLSDRSGHPRWVLALHDSRAHHVVVSDHFSTALAIAVAIALAESVPSLLSSATIPDLSSSVLR